MTETVQVPSRLSHRLWYGVGSAFLFITIATIEGMMRPDYDNWQQSVSALSLGSRGWIQRLNFVMFGAIIWSTAPAWSTIMKHGKGSKSFPKIIAAIAISLIACGIFQQDPAPGYNPDGIILEGPTWHGLVHLSFAALSALGSIAALIIMASRFTGDPAWHGWSAHSLVMAIIIVVSIFFYAIGSTERTGYAGIYERLAMMALPIWGLTFLLRLGTGVTFMHKEKENS